MILVVLYCIIMYFPVFIPIASQVYCLTLYNKNTTLNKKYLYIFIALQIISLLFYYLLISFLTHINSSGGLSSSLMIVLLSCFCIFLTFILTLTLICIKLKKPFDNLIAKIKNKYKPIIVILISILLCPLIVFVSFLFFYWLYNR